MSISSLEITPSATCASQIHLRPFCILGKGQNENIFIWIAVLSPASLFNFLQPVSSRHLSRHRREELDQKFSCCVWVRKTQKNYILSQSVCWDVLLICSTLCWWTWHLGSSFKKWPILQADLNCSVYQRGFAQMFELKMWRNEYFRSIKFVFYRHFKRLSCLASGFVRPRNFVTSLQKKRGKAALDRMIQ